MSEIDIYELTIIGGGPAGLFAAFYSGLRQIKTKLIESQSELGGKINLYPEKTIWDVGGVPPTPGAKLKDQLIEQALLFQPTVSLNEKVTAITRNGYGVFVLETTSGNKHYTQAVLIATGSGIITPKKLQLANADRYQSGNLHYTVNTLKFYKDKQILISGGGHSAVDWATTLKDIAAHIYWVYRRDEASGHEAQIAQLQIDKVTRLPNTTLTKLIPGAIENEIASVELTNNQTGEITRLAIDELIVSHGYEIDSSLLNETQLGIETTNQATIAGTANGQTNIPGIYAAGDILQYDGKLNLIAGTFQDAANAVNKIKQFIDPKADETAMVSSHNEMFVQRNHINI